MPLKCLEYVKMKVSENKLSNIINLTYNTIHKKSYKIIIGKEGKSLEIISLKEL